jgi:hypothetical protein
MCARARESAPVFDAGAVAGRRSLARPAASLERITSRSEATVTVSNAAPDHASGVTVTDTLPAATAFVSATPSQGTCSGTTTVTWPLRSIGSGAGASVDIVVQTTQAETLAPQPSRSSRSPRPPSATRHSPLAHGRRAAAPRLRRLPLRAQAEPEANRGSGRGEFKTTKTARTRTVRLLAPLASDLLEWRISPGGPAAEALVFPGRGGVVWGDDACRYWRRRIFTPAARAAGTRLAGATLRLAPLVRVASARRGSQRG